MRTLTFEETTVVSGGDDCELDEVVVTGKRPAPSQIYAQAFDHCKWALSGGGGGWGGCGGGLDEVVITGKKCTGGWSCLSQEELEAFLENTYTAPPSGGGGGGAVPDGISVAKTEELLAKAMAEQNEELRNQAFVGAALAAMGMLALAFPPATVALGIAGLISKFGIATAAAVLTLGGTWMFTDAMDELDNGR